MMPSSLNDSHPRTLTPINPACACFAAGRAVDRSLNGRRSRRVSLSGRRLPKRIGAMALPVLDPAQRGAFRNFLK